MSISLEEEVVRKLSESKTSKKIYEDWRSNTFDEGDLKLYCDKMVKEAERLAYSINSMSEEHPEYTREFAGLKGRIIKRFR